MQCLWIYWYECLLCKYECKDDEDRLTGEQIDRFYWGGKTVCYRYKGKDEQYRREILSITITVVKTNNKRKNYCLLPLPWKRRTIQERNTVYYHYRGKDEQYTKEILSITITVVKTNNKGKKYCLLPLLW